ncbi:hypothetical protein BB560_004455 [Smittium megazygosporum]|uniref:Chromatin modification-related protein EAF6 n=1 Tax=Smittium megazygosporum TaxID=133381 RepID=A0A2T9Z961_9FUNG|nr:hypothetical protein BB560_004455 [Smittium megazygosporum]
MSKKLVYVIVQNKDPQLCALGEEIICGMNENQKHPVEARLVKFPASYQTPSTTPSDKTQTKTKFSSYQLNLSKTSISCFKSTSSSSSRPCSTSPKELGSEKPTAYIPDLTLKHLLNGDGFIFGFQSLQNNIIFGKDIAEFWEYVEKQLPPNHLSGKYAAMFTSINSPTIAGSESASIAMLLQIIRKVFEIEKSTQPSQTQDTRFIYKSTPHLNTSPITFINETSLDGFRLSGASMFGSGTIIYSSSESTKHSQKHSNRCESSNGNTPNSKSNSPSSSELELAQFQGYIFAKIVSPTPAKVYKPIPPPPHKKKITISIMKISKKALKQAEQELMEFLIEKKKAERDLQRIEASIYEQETNYLKKSENSEGNILVGFSPQTRNTSDRQKRDRDISNETNSHRNGSNHNNISGQRIFSGSSVSFSARSKFVNNEEEKSSNIVTLKHSNNIQNSSKKSKLPDQWSIPSEGKLHNSGKYPNNNDSDFLPNKTPSVKNKKKLALSSGSQLLPPTKTKKLKLSIDKK